MENNVKYINIGLYACFLMRRSPHITAEASTHYALMS